MEHSNKGHRRVVVTGIGIFTTLGRDIDSFWTNILNGKSGVTKITTFDASQFDCQIAAEIKEFDPVPYFKVPKDTRRCDRYSQLAMAAAKGALADSGLDLSKINHDRFGCLVGSGIGGLQTLELQHSNLLQKGPSRLSPFMIPMMISNMGSGMISMEFGARGPNMSVVTACSTSTHSIGESFQIIRRGEADIMIAGGSEAAICPLGIGGFGAMRALSTRNNE